VRSRGRASSARGPRDLGIERNGPTPLLGRTDFGAAWHGMAWHGMAWHGMAWYGMVWHGAARHRRALRSMVFIERRARGDTEPPWPRRAAVLF